MSCAISIVKKLSGLALLRKLGVGWSRSLSPDGDRRIAVSTPDNTIKMFAVDVMGHAHLNSVAVRLAPIAMAFRNDAEGWVVNSSPCMDPANLGKS